MKNVYYGNKSNNVMFYKTNSSYLSFKQNYVVVLIVFCFFCLPTLIYANGIRLYKHAKLGDVCLCIEREYYYVRSKDARKLNDSDILEHAIGVVFYKDSNSVKIVSKDKPKKSRWANAISYKIPQNVFFAKGAHTFSLLNRNEFTFNIKYDCIKSEECAKALNIMYAQKKLDDWHTFVDNEMLCIAYFGPSNDSVGYDVLLDGKKLERLTSYNVGLPQIIGYCTNTIGQKNWICGMNKKRMQEHCMKGTELIFNPKNKDEIDGINKLYEVLPVSLSFYSQSQKLRNCYSSYSKYLDACMADNSENCGGVMELRDGKYYTKLLANKIINNGKEEIREYPAAYIASIYSCKIENFEDKGLWWLPTMYDLSLLMANYDVVNNTLSQINGWCKINSSEFYWSCCPNSSYYAWFYHCDGMSDANNMEGADNNGNLLFNVLPIIEVCN